jgi:F-type H+/Na+-transporting ATPase subunit alpha
MELRAEEISQIIKEQITDYDKKVELSETGVVVLSVGDGISRVYGLEKVMALELVEVSGRGSGARAQPGRRQCRCRHHGG